MVGTTEAPGILHGDSPVRTKHSTGINNICIPAGRSNQHLLQNTIQPHLAWTRDAGDLLLSGEEAASVPTAVTSALPARVAPWAALQQGVLSTEPKRRAHTQLAAGCAAPAKAHLAVIFPSAAQGCAEPITASPQR